MGTRKYVEDQRFRRWDVLAFVTFLLALAIFRFIEGLYLRDWQEFAVAILCSSLLGITLYFLLSIRLIVKIDENKISYRYYPLHFRKHKIKWEEIEQCELVDTPVASELSGWAVRFASDEKMFSVSGRRGLYLQLKDGREFFIGSKHLGELSRWLEREGKLIDPSNTAADS